MEKRKKRIATGLVFFLIFMWVCTLVSKSIYASKLPMITTTRIESKYIEHTVETEGIVEAGAKLPVVVLSGLRVKELAVQVGDKVEEGDLLFTVDLEDLQEMLAEQETAASKVQLEIDAILHNKELAEAQKALEEARAREDYDALARYQDTLVGRAAEEVAQAEEELEELKELDLSALTEFRRSGTGTVEMKFVDRLSALRWLAENERDPRAKRLYEALERGAQRLEGES